MTYVKKFQDLIVYQKSLIAAQSIFELTTSFSIDEKYSLTDQIRRSSRSVGAQIAEAWGKRNYPKHFISKLTDADSEQLETQHWLLISLNSGCIDNSVCQKLTTQFEEIGKMLNSMMRKSNSFCSGNSEVKEDEEIYFVSVSSTEH
ncbi:MAG: four helix bundle protein [Lentisphaeraceae bacterium]|nr:four helix bundle protein [Lentisphaeraceae bacterium]